MLLSALLVLSIRLPVFQDVLGKNDRIDPLSAESDSCHNQILQIDSVCRLEKSNIQGYDTEAREHYANYGELQTRTNAFMQHYDDYQAEEFGLADSSQNDNVPSTGNVNHNDSVVPALVGHNGGGSGTGDGGHNGGGHNSGGHNGGGSGTGDNKNNDQNKNHKGENGNGHCTPVTLSGLPGQTKPVAICLVNGVDTNVATEIGFATFTLVQLNNGEFRLSINGLNGQTQPAIVTVTAGVSSPIIVPGSGTGNVLIGDGYSLILNVPRTE